MNTLYILLALVLLFTCLLPYFKERRLRKQSEKMLELVRQIARFDDRIFRMRLDDPDDWPASREAQMLIVHRITLHEEYAAFLRHHPLRDIAYMKELTSSATKTATK